MRVSFTADSTQLSHLICSQPYGLLVLDAVLPGLRLPLLLNQLHHNRPTQRILLLTTPNTSIEAAPLPWPGTRLSVSRQALPGALVAALEPWLAELRGETTGNAWRGTWSAASSFSPRELEVLSLVVADHCNAEIADKLCLSVRTVESHRRMLLQKAGTKTLVGLAARAVREGWVS
jgi:DNA-binding NarL/FixJ family response regulator